MARSHDFEGVAVRVGVVTDAAVPGPVLLRQKLSGSQRTKQSSACSQQRGVQEIPAANGLIHSERLVVLLTIFGIGVGVGERGIPHAESPEILSIMTGGEAGAIRLPRVNHYEVLRGVWVRKVRRAILISTFGSTGNLRVIWNP